MFGECGVSAQATPSAGVAVRLQREGSDVCGGGTARWYTLFRSAGRQAAAAPECYGCFVSWGWLSWVFRGAVGVGLVAGGAGDAPVPEAQVPEVQLLGNWMIGATQRAKACLRGELPSRFDASKYPAVRAAVRKCLGDGPFAIDASGVRQLRFGKETRTGRVVELLVTCGDLCPHYTQANVAYEGIRSLRECLCIGGSYFGGCAPSHEPRAVRDVHVKRHWDGKEISYRMYGGVRASRGEQYGLHQGWALLEVDGHKMMSAAHGQEALDWMPVRPPKSLLIASPRSDRPPREVHYVPWHTIEYLRTEVSRFGPPFPRARYCSKNRTAGVGVDGLDVMGLDQTCRDEDTKARLRLARSIRREARNPSSGSKKFPGCDAMAGLAMAYSATLGGLTVEARYVGWLPARGGW